MDGCLVKKCVTALSSASHFLFVFACRVFLCYGLPTYVITYSSICYYIDIHQVRYKYLSALLYHANMLNEQKHSIPFLSFFVHLFSL